MHRRAGALPKYRAQSTDASLGWAVLDAQHVDQALRKRPEIGLRVALQLLKQRAVGGLYRVDPVLPNRARALHGAGNAARRTRDGVQSRPKLAPSMMHSFAWPRPKYSNAIVAGTVSMLLPPE
jgi:hypothetical protein